MSTIVLYGVTAILLAFSFFKDRKKTLQALRKAFKALENILPEFLVVILLVGLLLALMDPAFISRLIGVDSGILGMVIALMLVSVYLPIFSTIRVIQ